MVRFGFAVGCLGLRRLLAGPDNAVDPGDFGEVEAAVAMVSRVACWVVLGVGALVGRLGRGVAAWILGSSPRMRRENREGGYWLAQMMRWIQATSERSKLRSRWAGLRLLSSMRRAERRASCLAMTSPARVRATTRSPRRMGGGGGDDDGVAVAEDGLHAVAGNFEAVGVGVADFGEAHFVPAAADGEAGIVEEAVAAGLGEADERDPARRAGGADGAVAGDERGKLLEAGAGGIEHFGEAFAAGPAGASVRHAAFAGVEGGGVEARAFGEAGGGEAVFGGQRVERAPDIFVFHRNHLIVQPPSSALRHYLGINAETTRKTTLSRLFTTLGTRGPGRAGGRGGCGGGGGRGVRRRS